METKYIDCPFEIKAEDVSDKGVFTGYGSTFGGKPDAYGDVIIEGAFSETLEKGGRNATGVAMLWQHQSNSPIGVWKQIEQNKKGLKVTGELILEVQQAKEAFALMKKGALKGLSIGWDFMRDSDGNILDDAYEINEKKRIRLLKRLELWEISPVTFPANTRATITNVKNIIQNAKNERELEEAFREELRVSNSTAKYLVSLVKPVISKQWKTDKRDKSKELTEIVNIIKKLNIDLKLLKL